MLRGGSLRQYLIIIPAVLICLTFHEAAHGLTAYWLGDDTAKRSGRLTLNPLDHLDPIGTLCMIFFGFGWAKPVPVNTSRFKNRKAGMALTALAGPLSNFLLSILLILAAVLLEVYAGGSRFAMALAQFFAQTGQLSVGLGVFNLLPVPPLDGSRVLQAFLPDRLYYKFYNYQAYFQIALIILLFLGAFNNILYRLQGGMTGVILRIVSALLGLFGI